MPADLMRLGIRWVRLVSRPGVEQYINWMQEAGIMVLAVVNEQSGGYLCPADVYQIGNEPDVLGTKDSMSPVGYRSYFRLYRETYPDLTMIGAGLGSGQTNYWALVEQGGGLPGASGFAVHPYAKKAPQARLLLNQYRTFSPNLPLWCTEINRSAAELPEFVAMLKTLPVAMWAWFCWSEDFARQAGIYPLDERQKRVLGACL
jgi:hypothetical protein